MLAPQLAVLVFLAAWHLPAFAAATAGLLLVQLGLMARFLRRGAAAAA